MNTYAVFLEKSPLFSLYLPIHCKNMKESLNIDCLIPCAGLSERMGSWKPMIDYRGRPLIVQVVEKALSPCQRVILVTGYRGEELEELFALESRVDCVRNREYGRGMFSSIQRGVSSVRTPAFFVSLGDMPEIPADIFQTLSKLLDEHPEADIARPLHHGRPGHPVLLRKTVVPTILDLPAESNMQEVFRRHQNSTGQRVIEIAVSSPGTIYDIDRREDLAD